MRYCRKKMHTCIDATNVLHPHLVTLDLGAVWRAFGFGPRSETFVRYQGGPVICGILSPGPICGYSTCSSCFSDSALHDVLTTQHFAVGSFFSEMLLFTATTIKWCLLLLLVLLATIGCSFSSSSLHRFACLGCMLAYVMINRHLLHVSP